MKRSTIKLAHIPKIFFLTVAFTTLLSCGSHPKNYENALDFALSSPSKK